MKPIDKDLCEKAQEWASKAGKLEEIITERIDYIVNTVFKTFNLKIDCWYFYGAGEGQLGNLWPHYNEETIDIITEVAADSKEPVIIDKNGNEFGFCDSIPTRWLFEDFEQELIDGKKKFEERIVQRKLKQKEESEVKKKEQQVLIESVKKKLTKKELAAIKRMK